MNRGVAPPDPETPVGELRFLIGDTQYTELDPPEAGYGNYTNFSDDQLEAFITQSDGSIVRAAGYSYLTLAAAVAASSVSWKSDDLAITDNRAKYLTDLANFWFSRADDDDASAASDGFDVVYPFGNPYDWDCDPELAQRRFRGTTCW